MIKDIREIDKEKGIIRVTTQDSRFYSQLSVNKETGIPELKWKPSVTWIKSYYYMSPYLLKWIAEKGIDEAESIKKEAGIKGDKIHQASEMVDRGEPIKIDQTFLNKNTGIEEELNFEELEAIKSYQEFIDEEKPELLAIELTVFNKEGSAEEFGGTIDRIFSKGFVREGVRQIWIADIKSSQSVYKDMIIQLSAYGHADIDYKSFGISDEEWINRKLFIIQVGYRKNKRLYKVTEVPDRYDLFKTAYKTWKEENPDAKPKQRDFPLIIQSKHRLRIDLGETKIKEVSSDTPKVKKPNKLTKQPNVINAK